MRSGRTSSRSAKIRRHKMLDHGKVREVPRDGKQFTGGLLIRVGQRVVLFGGLGRGTSVRLDGGFKAQPLRLLHDRQC